MKARNPIEPRMFLAMLPPVAAFILQWTFWSEIQPFAWFLFFPAVFISSWIGGLIPGLVSTFISAVTVSWFFIAPQFTFSDKTPMANISIGLFCIMGFLFSSFHGRLTKANKQAEDANNILRASEKRYRTLFESMDEGFCVIEMIYDSNGKPVDYRFAEINSAFEKHTGLQQAQGKTMREMVPDHDEHWFETYGKVARTGVAIRFENPATAMHRYYDVYAFRIGEVGSSEVGILFKDITERKQAEQTLQSSEENLSVTFNSIGDAVMATDVEGKITRLNCIAEQLTGWSQAEAVGHPVEDIFHIINRKTRKPAPIPVAAALAQGTIQSLVNDTVLIARDGRELPIADSWPLSRS